MPNPKYIKTAEKCVYKYEKDGELFWAYRYSRKENGKIKQEYVRFDSDRKPFVTYAALMAEVEVFLARKNQSDNTIIDSAQERPKDAITINELWEFFKSLNDTNNKKADTTIIRYDKIYKNHIANYKYKIGQMEYELSKMPVKAIPVGVIIDFLTSKLNETYIKDGLEQTYKRSYINGFRKFFVLIFNFGKKYNLISREKANELLELQFDDNSIKSEAKEAIRVLTPEQIHQIEELLKDTEMYLPFMVGLLAGCRTGEAFAVRFNSFRKEGDGDDAKYYLDIKAQMVEVNRKFYLRAPKTFARTVPIPKKLYDIAMERKKEIDKLKEIDRLIPVQSGFLTPMQSNYVRLAGNVLSPNEQVIDDFISMANDGRYLFYTGSFKKYAAIIRKEICPHENGVEDFSFYTARKTFLSNMANTNCPVNMLAKIAGHKKITTLLEHYYENPDQDMALSYVNKAMERMEIK